MVLARVSLWSPGQHLLAVVWRGGGLVWSRHHHHRRHHRRRCQDRADQAALFRGPATLSRIRMDPNVFGEVVERVLRSWTQTSAWGFLGMAPSPVPAGSYPCRGSTA